MFDKFRKKKDEFGSVSSGTEGKTDQSGKIFQYDPREAGNTKTSEVMEESRFHP